MAHMYIVQYINESIKCCKIYNFSARSPHKYQHYLQRHGAVDICFNIRQVYNNIVICLLGWDNFRLFHEFCHSPRSKKIIKK